MNRLTATVGYQFDVDYEIEPQLNETLHERDVIEVTVRGTVYNRTGGGLQCISFDLQPARNYGGLFFTTAPYQNITVYNGGSAHFEMTGRLEKVTGVDYYGNQIIKLYPFFTIFQYRDMNYNGNYSATNIDYSQFLYLRQNLVIIESREIDYVRARLERGKFVEDNEGHNVLCKKIALSIDDTEYYDIDSIDIAKIQIYVNDNEQLSVDIPREKLELMLSDVGYSEADYTSLDDILLKDYDFEPGEYYKITITIGNSKAPSVFVNYIERAYANMHFSGASTGGVAFGMFSTSTQGSPKFECAYPAYFYGGFSQQAQDMIADILYPVGAVYVNYAGAESPVDLYGGEWEQIDNTGSQLQTKTMSITSDVQMQNKVTIWVRKSLNGRK